MSRKKLPISKIFSTRLIKLIKELGFKDRELFKFAKEIGISASFLSDIINLKSGPSFLLLSGISNNFPQVNIDWLISGEGFLFKDIKYQDDQKIGVAELGTVPYDIDGLLDAAIKILTSGNQAAVDALERNIRYFSHTIDIENRLKGLEQARIDNEKRITSLEERKKTPFPGDAGDHTVEKAT